MPADWSTAVFDMLSQLVRNAIEHGIESADVRRRRGKSAAGTLPFVGLQTGDTGVRSIESVTFSVAGGGLVCLVIVKPF